MRIAALATTIWLTVLGAIAPAQSVTHDDRAVNFSSYQTYAWTPATEPSDEQNHARIIRAIDTALLAKGVARVAPSASPDLLLAYHASFDKNMELLESIRGWGPLRLGGGRWGFARVQPVLIGTLGVEITDARTNAIVWRSFASSDLRTTDKPQSRDRKLAKAAHKLFKHYPPRR